MRGNPGGGRRVEGPASVSARHPDGRDNRDLRTFEALEALPAQDPGLPVVEWALLEIEEKELYKLAGYKTFSLPGRDPSFAGLQPSPFEVARRRVSCLGSWRFPHGGTGRRFHNCGTLNERIARGWGADSAAPVSGSPANRCARCAETSPTTTQCMGGARVGRADERRYAAPLRARKVARDEDTAGAGDEGSG